VVFADVLAAAAGALGVGWHAPGISIDGTGASEDERTGVFRGTRRSFLS